MSAEVGDLHRAPVMPYLVTLHWVQAHRSLHRHVWPHSVYMHAQLRHFKLICEVGLGNDLRRSRLYPADARDQHWNLQPCNINSFSRRDCC